MRTNKFLIVALFSVNILSVYTCFSDSYIGCYVDSSNRDLDQFQGDAFTVDGCIEQCKNGNYQYAGLQWYGQCFCGDEYGQHGQANANDCNTPCISDNTQICGGGWRNSIYSTQPPQTQEQSQQSSQPDGYLGCYVDSSSRDLQFFQGNNYSVDSCKQKCSEQGYAYAGSQYYGQCFCDNDYGGQGQVQDQECSTPCNAMSQQMCGGAWRNSVYQAASDQIEQSFAEGYLGCFVDSSNRDLANFVGDQQTVESCNQLCANNGYRYAGSQYYGQCFCDIDYGAYGQVNDSECNTACSTNNSQKCGGVWRNSVYEVSHLIERTTKPEGYIGCYIDMEDRDLFKLLGSDYTPTRCRQACADHGYKFSGIQYYGQCFCGQDYGKHGLAEQDTDCNTRCSADQGQICGGAWRNEIYDASSLMQTIDLGDNYLGCFSDSENRDLPNYIGNTYDLQSCQQECAKRGYFYSGSQYYGQCYCGDEYGAHGELERSECDTNCNSNTAQMCGGEFKNSIFSLHELIDQESYPIEYLGCFIDTSIRDLANYKGDGYTIEDCLNECQQNNFRYAGLQYYGQCFCDTDFGVHGQAVETDCNTPCDADSTQMCGGVWRNDIYDLTPSPRNPISQYTYIGCYEDKETRDLEVYLGDGFQVEQCLLECFAQGYRYAGLQYFGQCFCDNDYGLYEEKPEEECQSRCNSDPTTTCGGTWRNQIYTFGVAQEQGPDPSTVCITAYPDCDFGGDAVEICGNEPLFGPIMKSFQIPDGVSIKVYNQSVDRSYEFKGDVQCIFGGYKGVQVNI